MTTAPVARSPRPLRGTLSKAPIASPRPGVPIETHKLWPPNMPALGVELSGRIPPPRQPSPGTPWPASPTSAGGPGYELWPIAPWRWPGPRGPGPTRGRGALRWKSEWPERPAAFAWVGSQRHPELVATLAEALGIGRPAPGPRLAAHHGSARPSMRTNSAQRPRCPLGNLRARPGSVGALPESSAATVSSSSTT